MKLARFIAQETTRIGIVDGDFIHDAAALYREAGEVVPEVVLAADTRRLIAAPEVVTVLLTDYLASRRKHVGPPSADGTTTFTLSSVRLLAPVPNPEKFICIGLNYADHCREQGKEPPPYPILFSKFANAVCGTGDPILLPPLTSKLDFEAELGVVIGRGGSCIPKEEALSHVFGYMCINDVSARDLQKSDGQWLRAKGMDNFGPTGPWVVTADEIPNPQSLAIGTRVNGETLQNSNTSEMIFPVDELIAFISRAVTLQPGDIISTGTPDGVGVHRQPPRFLQPGDQVEIFIEKIGSITNTVQARP